MPAPARRRRDLGGRVARRPADIDGRGAVYLAENEDGVVGGARAKTIGADVWYVVFAYVRPEARRRGVLKALLRELVKEGRERGSEPGHARRARRQRGRRRGVAAARLPGRQVLPRDRRRRSGAAALARSTPAPRSARSTSRPTTLPRSSGGCQVPAADRALGVDGGGRAGQRLDARRRRALRPRPASAEAPRQRAVAAIGGGRAHARGRGRARSSATCSGTGAASRTSTSRCRSTTARCRPATSSRSARTRRLRQRLTGADPARVRAVARTAAASEDLPRANELAADRRGARGRC